MLIRGESGAGKSTLAHGLVGAARRDGLFARLVADDRTRIAVRHGRLVAKSVPPLGGLIELRGIGLARVVSEPAAIIRLVVDLAPAGEPRDDGPRLPTPAEGRTELLGVSIARIRLHDPENVTPVLWLLRGGNDTLMTVP